MDQAYNIKPYDPNNLDQVLNTANAILKQHRNGPKSEPKKSATFNDSSPNKPIEQNRNSGSQANGALNKNGMISKANGQASSQTFEQEEATQDDPTRGSVMNDSIDPNSNEIEAPTAHVLVIYTGGTIGMKKTTRGFAPASNYLYQKLLTIPQFHDTTQAPLTTPLSRFGKRIHYEILEYEKLLDSSNMGMSDWVRIAKDVCQYYDKYDSFVILHGTDTMAYTAAALSFMLDNLSKTVIITGSQIPISVEPNDAVDNLSGALNIAGHYEIPEVTLYFNNKLFRGNRTTKDDATGLDAFKSPNFPPLVRMGINVKVSWEHILPPPVDRTLSLQTNFDDNIGVLKIFPAITERTIRNFLLPPLKGCVLETYGTGNAPDNRKDFLDALKEANDRGVVIVNVTQCSKGMVECNYATGRALVECGVISGYDMTTECAVAKLAYLFGKGLSPNDVKRDMTRNLVGEVTIEDKSHPLFSFKDTKFSQSMATLFKPTTRNSITDTKEMAKTEKMLLPALMCAAAMAGDIDQMKYLLKNGADINCGDYDLRTPLHIAVAEGQVQATKFLLENGAKVNVKDRWGTTPIMDAIRLNFTEIIQLLVAKGAEANDRPSGTHRKVKSMEDNPDKNRKAPNIIRASSNKADYEYSKTNDLPNGHLPQIQKKSKNVRRDNGKP